MKKPKVLKANKHFNRIVELISKKGGTYAFDGSNGVGKTTFISILNNELKRKGEDSIVLKYDFFLKPDEWRFKLESHYVRKKLKYLREDLFFDRKRFLKVLKAIRQFKKSKDSQITIKIKKAFDRKSPSLYSDKIFKITKRSIILVEGKYVMSIFKKYDLNFRLINDLKRSKKQFFKTINNQMKIKYRILRRRCFDLIYLPSYKYYEANTNSNIDYLIDLSDFYVKTE